MPATIVREGRLLYDSGEDGVNVQPVNNAKDTAEWMGKAGSDLRAAEALPGVKQGREALALAPKYTKPGSASLPKRARRSAARQTRPTASAEWSCRPD